MAAKRSRYKEMERLMTCVLAGTGGAFLLYLLFAGLGVVWLKVIMAIVAIGVSGLSLVFLYLNGEIYRQRSRWMVLGFGAVILCLVVSLLLNYPSPEKETGGTNPPESTGRTIAIVRDVNAL